MTPCEGGGGGGVGWQLLRLLEARGAGSGWAVGRVGATCGGLKRVRTSSSSFLFISFRAAAVAACRACSSSSDPSSSLDSEFSATHLSIFRFSRAISFSASLSLASTRATSAPEASSALELFLAASSAASTASCAIACASRAELHSRSAALSSTEGDGGSLASVFSSDARGLRRSSSVFITSLNSFGIHGASRPTSTRPSASSSSTPVPTFERRVENADAPRFFLLIYFW